MNFQFITSWDNERCGIILTNNEIVEVENKHSDPRHHFKILAEDVEPYQGQIKGLWHTHIDSNYNLSMADYECFLSLPELTHYIVTKDKVAWYYVDQGLVINGGIYDHN